MARKRSKALINFNIPKIGRIRETKAGLATTAVSLGVLAAGWYWSERIPYVGPYAFRVKALIRQAIGQQVRS